MMTLGIDPGYARVGWAVILAHSLKLTPVAYGCIETQKTMPEAQRLMYIFTHTHQIASQYKPDAISMEDVYFATNAKTAIDVGQARGVLLLAAAQLHIPVISYSPLTVKRTITGDGKADKKQVERMVMLTLKLTKPPKPDDTVDAIAIAMTHAYSYKMNRIQ